MATLYTVTVQQLPYGAGPWWYYPTGKSAACESCGKRRQTGMLAQKKFNAERDADEMVNITQSVCQECIAAKITAA